MKNHLIRSLTIIVSGMLLASCNATEPHVEEQPQAEQEKVEVQAPENELPKTQVPEGQQAQPQQEDASAPQPQSEYEAFPPEVELHLPEVDHQAAESPDGRLRIETFGTNDVVTAGGYFPPEEIRMVDIAAEKIIWSFEALYHNHFLWSPDSRYVAIDRQARTWGDALIVDTSDFSVIELPYQETLTAYWKNGTMSEQENGRSDPYFKIEEWPDNERLVVSFEWYGAGDDFYRGTYTYDVAQRKILEVEWR